MSRYLREPQQLTGLKYFTSRMTHQPDRLARQDTYLRALEVRGGVETIAGKFTSRLVRCRKCGKSFRLPQEKRTDVNLASHLVADAFDDRFDTFMLCTADSDLVPAVSLVQERFARRFILIDPPRRHSDELAAMADIHLHARETYYRQSQLPDPVEYTTRTGKVRTIARPRSWLTSEGAPSTSRPDDDGVTRCLSCLQPIVAVEDA
ncbi:MAG TPA: NYN domain-containing protein [Acidimicrobiales bacterium]|jgi:hypothetical protein